MRNAPMLITFAYNGDMKPSNRSGIDDSQTRNIFYLIVAKSRERRAASGVMTTPPNWGARKLPKNGHQFLNCPKMASTFNGRTAAAANCLAKINASEKGEEQESSS